VVVGVLIGAIRFRGLGYLTRLGIRRGWTFIGALALQYVSVQLIAPGAPYEPDLRGLLILLGYLGVIAGVILNWRLVPIRVLGLGFALNLLAVLPQYGYMPITVEAYQASGQVRPGDDLSDGVKLWRAKDIVLSRERTLFWPLTDTISVREPTFLRGVYSIGDLIVATGVALLASGVGVGGATTVGGPKPLE